MGVPVHPSIHKSVCVCVHVYIGSYVLSIFSLCTDCYQNVKAGSIFVQLPGPLVLQVAKMRNVSAPKAFEDSGGAPRMLRVSLTDGCITVQALEVQTIKPLR